MTPFRRAFFELSYLLGLKPWDTGISPPELLEFLEGHSPGRAIDLGCGSGTNVVTLAQKGWQVTGIDFSRLAICRARRKARRAGVQAVLLVGDASNLSGVGGPFDLALDIGCYHGLSATQQERYSVGLSQVLRPGGTFLLYGFERRDPDAPETWLTAEALRHRFGSGWELLCYQVGVDQDRPSVWARMVRLS